MELETGYAEAVAQAIFGYGRLSPVLSIPEAENIEITGWDSVMIQYGDGHREPHPPVADSDEELIEAIRFLGETANPPRDDDPGARQPFPAARHRVRVEPPALCHHPPAHTDLGDVEGTGRRRHAAPSRGPAPSPGRAGPQVDSDLRGPGGGENHPAACPDSGDPTERTVRDPGDRLRVADPSATRASQHAGPPGESGSRGTAG